MDAVLAELSAPMSEVEQLEMSFIKS